VQSAIKNGVGGGKNQVVKLDRVTVLPPVRRPGKIICMEGNVSDHLKEGTISLPPVPISF